MHGSYWLIRLAGWIVLVIGIAWAVAVVGLRYFLLPGIDAYRDPIVRSVSQAIGQKVEIGRIKGDWRGFRPALTFFEVRVHEGGGQQTLALDRVHTVLSWKTLISGTIVFKRIEFSGSHVEIRRDSIGTLWLAGEALQRRRAGDRSQSMKWLFAQEEIVVRGAQVTWIDEMRSAPALQIKDIDLRIENDGLQHRLGVTGTPPVDLASKVVVSIEFNGQDLRDFAGSGRVYTEFEYANLALARKWVPLPFEIDSGLGVMRLWLDIENRSLRQIIAEADLVNVSGRLGESVDPFALASVSGRIQWNEEESVRAIAVSGLTLETADGLRLPPADIRIRIPRQKESRREIRISSLDLAPLAGLSALLPVGAETRQRIEDFKPAGVIEELTASWVKGETSARELEAKAQFRDLAIDPVGSAPGFSGLGGTVSVNDSGGSLALKNGQSRLVYPQVFFEPIPFDYLKADAQWQHAGGKLQVDISSFSFTNEHAAGKVNGFYTYPGEGKGEIDLHAALVRAQAEDVWRYFPNKLETTRNWLRQGLVAGSASDARLRFKGPLSKFPFTDKADGLFEISASVSDGVVRIGEKWPLIQSISGEFRMDRDRIDIAPSVASIMDADVSQTRVSILDIGKRDVRLSVDGKAAGEVGQFLRFVENSPVAAYTKGATANMRGQGIGTLALNLDLPFFERSQLAVGGRLDIAGPEFELAAKVPELSDYAVRIEFDRTGVALRNGRGRMLGGPIRFSSAPETTNKGVPTTYLGGRAQANDLAAFFDLPALRRLYGEAEWNGQLDFKEDSVTHLRVDSTLEGLGSRLPAPLGKPDSSTLPISVQAWIKRGGPSEYALELEQIGSARLIADEGELQRGEVVFGGVADLPQRDGLSARGRVSSFDYDGWRGVFAETRAGNLASAEDHLRTLDLRVGSFRFGGRSFSQLHIEGKRVKDSWQLALDGPQVKGNVVSTSGEDGQRINARFRSLVIARSPPTVTEVDADSVQVNRRIPAALNVIVDALEYEDKPLGRLEMLAEPEPEGWRLDRLAITNPDGRVDIKGRWRIVNRPRAEYTVRFEATDNGQFFKRLGYEETIVGGTGSLGGPVSWLGGPFEPDLPTLNGKLKLQALDGRFAQVDPGAAQLFGILSLQALPRRISLNFKDVFTTGFSFDKIEADVTITDGVARTDDFHMDGVSANVSMQGEVDLVNRTQNLDVRVTPMLTGAAAVAGAAVINPLVGVAALLVQKALGDPVEQAAAREYQVSGTWQDPQVERVEREPEAGSAPAPGR